MRLYVFFSFILGISPVSSIVHTHNLISTCEVTFGAAARKYIWETECSVRIMQERLWGRGRGGGCGNVK